MIGNGQWEMISDVLLAIHAAEDLELLQGSLLEGLRTLVPYDKAMFFAVGEFRGEPIPLTPYTFNVPAACVDEYERRRFSKGFPEDAAVPLTQVWEIRSEHEIRALPQMEYGVRINVAAASRIISEVALFRAKAGEPFTENEMEILRVLANHLEICMKRGPYFAGEQKQVRQILLREELRNMTLTEAEIEIVMLVVNGATNEQICEMKRIAPSTVKKHLSRIYEKFGVAGKPQMEYEIRKMMRER